MTDEIPDLLTGTEMALVLDPVIEGLQPDYCVHGKTRCMASGCGSWCWLGDKTYRAVLAGEAIPICYLCAVRLIKPDTPRAGRIWDHRRADGPH